MWMRLLIISDIHGRVDLIKKIPEVGNVDVVVFAGDIAPYGAVHRAYEALVKFVKQLRGSVVVAVPGNMDPAEAYYRAGRELGIKVVHGDAAVAGDAVFIGVGGSPPTPFGTITEFTEDEIGEILEKAYSRVRRKRENIVLVSHGPPYGTKCDIVFTGKHVGSVKVREFIEKHQLVLCVCGHIHESRAVDELGDRKIVNPGPLFRGYYAVARLVGGRAEVELKRI